MARDVPKRSYLGTPATAPGPTGPQMLPAFAAIRRQPLDYLHQSWQRYGDVVQFPIPRPPSYLLVEPSAVRQVLVDRARDFTKETLQYRSLALVTGQGLLVARDVRERRRVLQPAFHHERLIPLVEHVGQAGGALVEQWRRLPRAWHVDIEQAMATVALETVGRALFGQDLSGDAQRLVLATLEGLNVVIARARMPLAPPSWVPSPRNRQLARANAELDRAVHALVSSRASRSDPSSRHDVIDLLLSARNDEGKALSERQIRDELVTMIVAGHETVASVLTWCLALLASHPDIQQQVREESTAVVGRGRLSLDALAEMTLVRAVIDETMRLYPPAWLISRKAEVDAELAGALIPEGALVIMSPYLVHRHPAYWCNPEVFDPMRFVGTEVPREAFIPFGAGPRQCIGRDFAYAEVVALLALLIVHFDFAHTPGAGLPLVDASVTMRPLAGLHLVVSALH